MKLRSADIFLLILLLLPAALVGFYFEELTDIVFSFLFTGLLQSSPGSIFNNYECLFGISWLVHIVQVWLPHINAWGVLLILINGICIYLILLIFYHFFRAHFEKRTALLLFGAVYLILLYDFLLIQFTKTAIYCCFLGFYYLLHEPRKTRRAMLLILTGLLLRAEAFWLMLLVSLAAHLFYWGPALKEPLSRKKFHWLLLLLLGLAVSFLNKRVYNADDARYDAFRAYKYALVDFRPDVAKKLNERDSVRLDAMQHFFFGDHDSLINRPTFERLGVQSIERFSFLSSIQSFSANEFRLKMVNIRILLKAWKELYLLWVALLLFAAISLYGRDVPALKRMLGLVAFMLLFLTAITAYIKMESRVLHPLLLITLFYVYRLGFGEANIREKIRKRFLSEALILVCCYLLFFKIFFVIRDRIRLENQSEHFFTAWKKDHKEDILVPDLHSWQLFSTQALYDPAEYRKLRMISLDDGYMCMMQQHLDYMKAMTGSDHFKDYLSYVETQRSQIYFLGTAERTQVLEDYIKAIYGRTWKLQPTTAVPVVSGYGPTGYLEFYLYRLP